MYFEALNRFLSEENIRRHEEYVKTQRLRLSIIEKSDCKIQGKTIAEIRRMNIDWQLKREIVEIKKCILSHERFFDSFSINHSRNPRCEKVIYDIFTTARKTENSFLYVFFDGRGVRHSTVMPEKYDFLCLDLYEHCYFLDYGFKKECFLRKALGYLDIGRVLDN